jgi:hypothetical protein
MCQIHLKTNTMNFIQIQSVYLKTGGICEGKFIQHAEKDSHKKNQPSVKQQLMTEGNFLQLIEIQCVVLWY